VTKPNVRDHGVAPATLAAALTLVLLSTFTACGTTPSGPPPLAEEIEVTGGLIRGEALDDGTLHSFKGIPFSAPPVDDLRWAPPQSVVAWEATHDATAFGPACVQPTLSIELYASEEGPEDEDCLTLNVWTAAQNAGERRPVMVWIHGGALIYGAGSRYNGAPLARKGVVVVTINYRLGPFGFLAHPDLSAASSDAVSGNQGFLDQIQALEWVRDNIAAFGGDPERVTIFGESAGSLAVSALMTSPLAAGLFHGAIGQSGSMFAHRMPLREPDGPSESGSHYASAEALGVGFAEALGVHGADPLSAMRDRSAEEVLSIWNSNPAFADYFSLPAIDGHVFPATAAEVFAQGLHNDVPLMLGSNADEGTAIAPAVAPDAMASLTGYESWVRARLGEHAERALELYPAASDKDVVAAMNDLVCDEMFTWAMQAWARGTASGQAPAYLYYFSRVPPGEQSEVLGAYHAAEIPYVFATVDSAPFTAIDRALSDAMSDAWVRFAATGDPNGGDLPEWQPYSATEESYLEFGDEIRTGTGLRSDKVALWQAYYEGGGQPPRIELQ